ncbi:DoxX family protein [Moraxella sp. FZLJ2107]|uniref:DoxX family protein n=1 Tax=unclassified Moraxella TaxID=2685852 RepID=UPI0020C89B1E|nr:MULTISPECIES: DoxX family protein [unclassified Moraxella]UTO04583.1 DoxX family protein [Moraxella sp. FZLJ2107]UTO23416.1 DoxX family protein [Moraxella sp. FZLJ2109]
MPSPNQLIDKILAHPTIGSIVALVARLLLSYLFITSGWAKITNYAGTAAYFQAGGVPTTLLPLVIVVEFIGGLMILFGIQTRFVALVIGTFAIAAAFIMHSAPEQAMDFMKNFAIGGGFFALMLHGAGSFSIDGILSKSYDR